MSMSRRELLKAGAAAVLLPPAMLASPARADDPVVPYTDAVLENGEPPVPAEGAFTLVVLPDTQYYTRSFPQHFQAQTRWIAAQRTSRNIVGVLQLGDLTDHNTREQWQRAADTLAVLHGQVPYVVVPGNHDYSERGRCTDRTTLINDYFPVAHFARQATLGGTYDREPEHIENSFHLLSVKGRKLLVLALEFGPRADVLRWANEVLQRHPDWEAILITHAYLYDDGTRYDWASKGDAQPWNPHSYPMAKASGGDVADGETLWRELVSRHENVILTFNGHVLGDGLARLTSQTPGGRDVHQMLVNFQMRANGGDGWLRLLEFQPDRTTVHVQDYSPVLGQRNIAPQNRFTLTLSRPRSPVAS
jgi:predicted phosphodiesterase